MKQQVKRTEKRTCLGCGSTKLALNPSSELICTRCGLVQGDLIMDSGPDWYASDEGKRHTGPPVSESIHDHGISSKIGWKDRDALGHQLTPTHTAVFRRLRKHDRRAHMANSGQTLVYAFQEQARTCHNLGLPKSVRERAAFLFRKISKERTLRGRPIEAVAAAAICLACKEYGLERGTGELVRESGADPRDFKRAYDMLAKSFHVALSPVEVTYYVHDVAEKLKIEDKLRNAVIKKLRGRKVLNKQQALKEVAAVMYGACSRAGEPVTQERIAEVINFSRASFSKILRRR